MKDYIELVILILLCLKTSTRLMADANITRISILNSCYNFNHIEFSTLSTREGLSNSQVNVIFRDRDGFMWFGTQSGLDRFDGYRFKNYFFNKEDKNSLPNNTVDDIQQDFKGDLWIHTLSGYCILDLHHECFDSNLSSWMQKRGMKGVPNKVLIDKAGNFWLNIYGKGCYFYDVHRKKACFFRQGTGIPKGQVVAFALRGNTVVITYRNGLLVCVDGYHQHIVWINRDAQKYSPVRIAASKTFIDKEHNYWLEGETGCMIYSSTLHHWFGSLFSFCKAMGISLPYFNLIVKDINQDASGRILLATDHQGLLILDGKRHSCQTYMCKSGQEGSLPDNTLQTIYRDISGGFWIGTYENGLAYCSNNSSRFMILPLGDVCSMCEDKKECLYCGTNDKGIVRYNPYTGIAKTFGMSQTGLGSNIVVSTLAAHDGSLYFGTYKGGLARFCDGHWTIFRAHDFPGQLASDDVWALCEDNDGDIIIGTLGAGLQIMNPRTRRFVTYNTVNSTLPSDYISSISRIRGSDKILIGHSRGFSVMDLTTRRIRNYESTIDGRAFLSLATNQVVQDSRGIFWMASPSGISLYDPLSGLLRSISLPGELSAGVGCSIVEDRKGVIWLVYDHTIAQVRIRRGHNSKLSFSVTEYNSFDGLQDRLFNYRSVLLTDHGDVLVGGQNGVSVIRSIQSKKSNGSLRVIFSGLMFFDHILSVGEKYDGHEVLKEALNLSRNVDLKHNENTFTVLLAVNKVTLPSRYRFCYRLEGAEDRWMTTAANDPNITFSNLSSGTYRLQVRVVNSDGTVNPDISTLTIHVHPPFYLSIGAVLFYVVAFLIFLYAGYHRLLKHQQEQFDLRQKRIEDKRERELNQLKLNFFTNITHELRTPLTLVLVPVTRMIKEEDDPRKKEKLQLVERNAKRLLTLVNQFLDVRKLDLDEQKLNAIPNDIVAFVRNICTNFQMLGGKDIQLSFRSTVSALQIYFDPDKMGKIVDNLLSNAYKFTPSGGKVTVSLSLSASAFEHTEGLEIMVADTGRGISNVDKKRVFDQFFQVNADEMQPFGGSGIGLNLVKNFAEMHGGTVEVKDNPGGGTIFVVTIPVRTDDSLEASPQDISGQVSMPSEIEGKGPSDKVKSSLGKDRKRFCLLLVDDSNDFLSFMDEVFSEWYDVLLAPNGKEALKQIRMRRPDIILSDVMMPVMDGNTFCKKIKSNPDTADIPFLMLTARLAPEQETEGLSYGADDYVTKPCSLETLHLRIEHLLEWHRRGETGSPSGLLAATEMPEADRKLIEKAEELVRSHLADPELSVESLSVGLNMSRVQLYKRMLEITSETPSVFIRDIRLKEAEKLLLDGSFTVSEVAYKVGFNNPRYFSKYFSEAYGIKPSQYRKKNKGSVQY